jgi:16S rRNA G527 N7-methylase RsmG
MEILTMIKLNNGKYFEDSKVALDYLSDKFGEEFNEIAKKSKRFNLLAIIEIIEIILKNPLDSLKCAEILQEFKEIQDERDF